MFLNLVFVSAQFLFAKSLTPSNLVVVKNDPMNMTCGDQSAYKIMWSYWPVGGSPADAIDIRRHGNKLFQNRFSIFDSDGISELAVSSVTFSDAGTYECRIFHALEDTKLLDETKSHAQLLVLDTVPLCASNSTTSGSTIALKHDEAMVLECSMTFRGNWFPKMEWSRYGHDSKTITRQSFEIIENNTTITSTLVVPAHNILMLEEDSPVEDPCFEFTTYFNRSNESVAHNARIYSADNDPNFRYTWISPKVNILYGPRRITILPWKVVFHPGDNLTCRSDSNPEASYHWKEENGKIVEGNVLGIDRNMIRSKPHVYECTSANEYGELRKIIMFSVSDRSNEYGTRRSNAILITCVVFGVVLMLTIILVFYAIRRNREGNGREFHKHREHTTPEESSNYDVIEYHESVTQPSTDVIHSQGQAGERPGVSSQRTSNGGNERPPVLRRSSDTLPSIPDYFLPNLQINPQRTYYAKLESAHLYGLETIVDPNISQPARQHISENQELYSNSACMN